MITGLFDRTIGILNATLDLRGLRHRFISSNIANQETPGYRAQDINFEAEIKRAGGDSLNLSLASTNSGHKASGNPRAQRPRLIERRGDEGGLDGNTVGVEAEMARLSENSLMYTIASKMLRTKFGTLLTAIKEGGR